MRDRDPNPISNILNIDEKMGNIRQLQLYDNNLVFDQQRPIFQQVIKLGNYLEVEKDQIFEQFLKNTGHIHPDEQTKRLAKEYLQIQYNIDRLSEGYLDELQQDLIASIDKIKNQIKQMREKILAYKKQTQEMQLKAQSEKIEIQHLKKFLESNMDYIEKLPKSETMIDGMETKFQKLMVDLLKLTKQKLKLYQDLYYQIVKIKQECNQKRQKLKKLKQILIKVKNDLKIISCAIPKAELEIEQIRQKIRILREQIRKIGEERRRLQQLQTNQNRNSASQDAQQISRNTQTFPVQNTLTRGKYYFTVRKEPKSCDWLWWILLLITFLLAVATILTFF